MQRRYLTSVLVVIFSLLVAATPAYLSADTFTALLGNAAFKPLNPMIRPGEPGYRSTAPGGGSGQGEPAAASHGNFDQPDMFTGTASYTYELKLPPGTNNMAPKLALVYRSSGGNGWFGMGWELEGLGCIEYSQKFGVPKYDGTDREFTLNMAGTTYELVPDASNVYSASDPSNIGYYHTKCETWMKIYFDGTYWTVTDKNGVQYRFGYTPDSKAPIVHHTFTRLWALDQVMDKHGNYITYSYILDAANGEYYPDTITYTKNDKTTLGKIKTVTFLRETRTDNIRPAARWMTHRISEIQVKVDGALVDKYTFAYRYSNCSFRSLLAAINRFGTGTTPETTTLTYAADSGALTWGSPKTYVRYSGPFADVNGDGLTDVVVSYTESAGYIVLSVGGAAISNGDETFTLTYPSGNGASISGLVQPHDIDADGKAEFRLENTYNLPYINQWPGRWVYDQSWAYPGESVDLGHIDFNDDEIEDCFNPYYTNYIWLSKDNEKGWDKRTNYLLPWPSPIDAGYCIPVIDVNGDGLVDFYSDKTAKLWLNDGNGHWLETDIWQPHSGLPLPTINGNNYSAWHDYDCDGLSDYYHSLGFFLNNGHGWTNRTEWGYMSSLITRDDFNSDGLMDFSKSNDFVLRLPNGQTKVFAKGASTSSVFACINDDPYPDAAVARFEPAIYNEVVVSYSNCKPDLLTQVKLPTGGKVNYEYKRVPIHPIKDGRQRGATWRQYVVSKITTDDGTGRSDAVYESSFEYPPEGGKHARREKASLGFEWVKKILPDGSYIKTYFNQCVETAGRVEAVETYTAEGQLIQKQENEWELRAMQGSPDGYAIILKKQTTTWYRSIGEPIISEVEFAYDLYGNPVTESRLGNLAEIGDEVTLVKEFININQGSDYFVGLPKRERALAHDGAVLADKLIWYDGQSYGQVLKGLVTEEKSWLDNFAGAATCTDEAFYAANSGRPVSDPRDPHPLITYGYDLFGNRTTVTKHNVRPDGTYEDQVETVAYDSYAHAMPVEQSNALGHTIMRTFDFGLGQPLMETDPNGAVKRFVYDALGRIKEEYGPRDTANPRAKYDYTYALTGIPATQYARIGRQSEVGADDYIWTEQYLDGFGRVWKERKQAPEGKLAIREQQYEWHGYKGREWLPYFSGSSRPTETKISVFDAFKRPVSVTMPDGASTEYTYEGLTTTITVANTTGNQVTRQTKDVYDRVVRVEQVNDDGTYVTTYGYDGLGRQIWLHDAMRNANLADTETVMIYDSLGRLLSKSDPYNGTQTYQYDSVGNVIKKVDAKNTAHIYEYDLLNRLVAKSYQEEGAPAPIVLSVLAYDEAGSTYGIGRLTSTYTGSSILDAEYGYDADGNIVTTAKHISGATYTTQAIYDAMNRVKQLTYPDGTVLNYAYEAEALKAVGAQTQQGGGEPYIPNLLTYNQSDVEIGTMGFVPWNSGSIIEQVSDEKYHDDYSLFIHNTSSSSTRTGVRTTQNLPLTAGKQYTIRVRLKGVGLVYTYPIKLAVARGGSWLYSSPEITLTDQWVEYSFSFTPSVTATNYQVCVEQVTSYYYIHDAFYLDCLMVCEDPAFEWYPGETYYYPPTPPAKGDYATYSGWNAAGLPGLVEYGNGTETAYTYHPLNQRLTNMVTHDAGGGVVQDFGYTFDLAGNITALTDNTPITALHTVNTSQSFTYDKLNRLMSSNVFGSYTYDRIGNITAKEGVTFTCNYSDPAHPYCPVSGTSGYAATYDANGNLATKTDKHGVGWRYEYNAENMLTRVWKTPPGGSEALIEEYGYGADGIRKTKTSYVHGQASTTKYVFLGNNVLYEVTGEVTAKYILAGDKEIAKVEGGGTNNLLTVNQADAETDLSGFWNSGAQANSKSGSYLAIDNNEKWHGNSSVLVATSTLWYQGVNIRWTGNASPGVMTFSAYIKAPAGTPMKLLVNELGSGTRYFATFVAGGAWERKSVTFILSEPAESGLCLQILSDSRGPDGYNPINFNIDGAQLQQGALTDWDNPILETYYTHRDHLGSSSVVTDSAGQVVCWNANHPYGEDWEVSPAGTPNIDKHRFTGKETDEGTGLAYFGARYYDPEVGRFTTVDPIGNGLNWYAYCANNPLKLIDPTGEAPVTVTSVGWYSMSYQQGRNVVHSHLEGNKNNWFDRIATACDKIPIIGDIFTGIGAIKSESDRSVAVSMAKLDGTLNEYEDQLKSGEVAILVKATTITTSIEVDLSPFYHDVNVSESTTYEIYVVDRDGNVLDSYTCYNIEGNITELIPSKAISVNDGMGITEKPSDPPTVEEAYDEYYD